MTTWDITNYPINVPNCTVFKALAPEHIEWKDLPFSKNDTEVLRAIYQENPFWDSFEAMSKSLSDKLKEIIFEQYLAPSEPEFKEALKGVKKDNPNLKIHHHMSIAYARLDKIGLGKLVKKMKEEIQTNSYRLERIARTESTAVTAKGREVAYNERDDGSYLYDWFGINDNRTSDQCKEIERRVNTVGKGKGVPMNVLKQIVTDVVNKFNEGKSKKWDNRDWSPHANCRRMLRKVN